MDSGNPDERTCEFCGTTFADGTDHTCQPRGVDDETIQTSGSDSADGSERSNVPVVDLGMDRRNLLKTASTLPLLSSLPALSEISAGADGFATVRGINAGDYPTVETTCIVDTDAGQNGELSRGAFTLEEEGEQRSIESFDVVQIDRSGEPEPLDIAFVFDDTGSMGPYIDGMQAAVTDFIDDLEAANVDGQYGLVSFKQDPANMDVDQELTGDAGAVQDAVNGLSASGGGAIPENPLDAIELALDFDFRTEAREVVITITDAPARHGNDNERDASGGTTDLTLADIKELLVGTTFIAISPTDEQIASYLPPEGSFMNVKRIAEQVDGFWLELPPDNIFEEFQARLETVQETLAATRYLLTYESPLPEDGELRTVRCTVEDPAEGTDDDTGEYRPPGFIPGLGVAVTIERTNAPVPAGETLLVDVRVENLDDQTGVLTVSLDTDGLSDITPGTSFRLDSAGEVETKTLEVETEPGDAGSYTLVAEGDGDPGEDTDSETVEVGAGGGATATVSGTVRDAETDDPLIEIPVTFTRLTGPEEESTAETVDGVPPDEGAPGTYDTSLPVDGDGETDYEITVEVDGYEAFEEEITLSPDEEATVPIELEPIRIETSRPTTGVLSPTTLQVVEPTDPDYTYEWAIVDEPTGTLPELLHETGEHTALHAKQEGEYEVEVTISDGDEVVATATETIAVIETLVDGPVSDGTTRKELVETYAPRYYFTAGEEFYPTRYEAYVEHAELRIDGGGETVTDEPSLLELSTPELIDEDGADAYDPSDSDNRVFLKGDEGDFKNYQSQFPETIYANVVPRTPSPVKGDDSIYTAITYWAFYLFDPKKGAEDGRGSPSWLNSVVAAHASDTETLTVLVDEDGPQWVGAAQHYSGEYLKWEKLTGSSALTTPDLFIAEGAHSTFLVNTDEYPKTIPLQRRWIDEETDSPATVAEFSSIFGDMTASDERWEYFDPDNVATEYDLVVLPNQPGEGRGPFDEEGWAEFGGKFSSGPGSLLGEGGTVPQVRGDRWNDPGEWIPDRMLPEHQVLDPDDDLFDLPRTPELPDVGRFTVDSVTGKPSAFKVENFANRGKKPHDFRVEAIINPENGSTKRYTDRLELAWDARFVTIGVPLEEYDLPDEGQLDVTVFARTYPAEIADDEDRVLRIQEATQLEDIGDIITDPIPGLGTQDMATVSPGEAVESGIAVENGSSDPQSLYLTLTAIGPEGGYYDDYAAGREIRLDPGERREVTLSRTIGAALPEGEYDLLGQVWLETDPDELTTVLSSVTEKAAFVLEKPEGEVEVTSTPPDIPVVADDELLGRTPISTTLPIGTYDIIGTGDDGEVAVETVEVTETGTTVSLDFSDSGSPLAPYTNEDGIVDTERLRQAIADWRAGEIDTGLLRQAIGAWRSGDPVA